MVATGGPHRRASGQFIVVALAVLAAAVVTAIIALLATTFKVPWATAPASRPANQAIRAETELDISDLYASVQFEQKIVAQYTTPGVSRITLNLQPRMDMSDIRADIIALSSTSVQVSKASFSKDENGWLKWDWDVTAAHNGRIGQSNEKLDIRVRYELRQDGKAKITSQKIPVAFSVEMSDFSLAFYLATIAVGTIASYLLAEGSKITPRLRSNFGEIKGPVTWIVLSLILTPMIYLQFRQAVSTVTDQAVLSLVLAAPFAAGLDFVLGRSAAARA